VNPVVLIAIAVPVVAAIIGGILIVSVAAKHSGGGSGTTGAAASASPSCLQLNGKCIDSSVPSVTPSSYTPSPADFKVSVHILKKDCFGPAGCNVTYRIEPAYSGQVLDDNQSFTVTYAVTGGEDPQSGSFTVTGSQASYSSEEFISTKSSKANLVVTVNEVIPN
jgi:hypothetical protein